MNLFTLTLDRTVAWPLLLMLAILPAGCDRPSQTAGGGNEATELAPLATGSSIDRRESVNSECFLLISDGLSGSLRSSLRPLLMQKIRDAAAGDLIHVIQTPLHTCLASIRVPAGDIRARLRDRNVIRQLGAVGDFLADESEVPDSYREQLGLPLLKATYWGLKQTDFPDQILFVGTPEYHDPEQSQWSFRDGAYPSPSALTNPRSTLPFLRKQFDRLPDNTQFDWLVPDPQWGLSKTHRERVIDFYRMLLASEYGGNLRVVTSTPAATMTGGTGAAFPTIEIPNDDLPPRMLRVSHEADHLDRRHTGSIEMPRSVTAEIERVMQSPDQILIAAAWTSGFADTDIDMRVRSKGHEEELSFIDIKTDFGRLVRDIVHTGAARDFLTWELAVINHDRLSDLDLWLNAFRANGPVDLTLLVVWRGKQYLRKPGFELVRGDAGSESASRWSSPSWLHVDLPALLHAS